MTRLTYFINSYTRIFIIIIILIKLLTNGDHSQTNQTQLVHTILACSNPLEHYLFNDTLNTFNKRLYPGERRIRRRKPPKQTNKKPSKQNNPPQKKKKKKIYIL